jgi:hypothetical protein
MNKMWNSTLTLRRRPRGLTLCFLFAAFAVLHCGYSQARLKAMSPNGDLIAEVRSHWTLDPPAQSLWITKGGKAERLARLGEDSEWCNEIVWSPDSSKVAFVISGKRLDVYDPQSLSLIRRAPLMEADDYPP